MSTFEYSIYLALLLTDIYCYYTLITINEFVLVFSLSKKFILSRGVWAPVLYIDVITYLETCNIAIQPTLPQQKTRQSLVYIPPLPLTSIIPRPGSQHGQRKNGQRNYTIITINQSRVTFTVYVWLISSIT